MISIDDFAKCDIRVVKVLTAERVEGSEKLLKLNVDIGDEEIGVLKEEQHADVKEHHQHEDEFFPARAVAAAADPERQQIVADDAGGHDGKIAHLAPGVEKEADEEQRQIFQFGRDEIIKRECDRQKAEDKQQTAENQNKSPTLLAGKNRRMCAAGAEERKGGRRLKTPALQTV